MVRQHADRMNTDSATRSRVTHCVDDMNCIRPRDVALAPPGVPRDVGVQANGFVKAGFPHGTGQSVLTPRC
jgi:hypothetical protein